ncbi:MAG: hypothetical protein EBQ87_00340, partial [Planctomycetes bacterium]|nr:hypothetical protein [Planctomycetota bacterium]
IVDFITMETTVICPVQKTHSGWCQTSQATECSTKKDHPPTSLPTALAKINYSYPLASQDEADSFALLNLRFESPISLHHPY